MKKLLIKVLWCLNILFAISAVTSCGNKEVSPEKIMTYVNEKMKPIDEITPLSLDVTYYELQENLLKEVTSEKIIISDTEIYMSRDSETEEGTQVIDEQYWFTIEKSETEGVDDKYVAYQKVKDENDGNMTSSTITKEEYDTFKSDIYKNFYSDIMVSDANQITAPGETKFVSGISNIYFTYIINDITLENVNYTRKVDMALSKHDGGLSIAYRLAKYSINTYDSTDNVILCTDVVFSEKEKDTTIPSR